MKLRPYQQESIDQTLDWLCKSKGNLVLSLSTGSGKSVIIAEFCRMILSKYKDTKILMLVHTRELIRQNYEKLLTIWGEAPVGIFSAGLNRKDTNQITYAGIQSIHKHPEKLGHVDLCIVDECHLISHKDEGTYRKLISSLSLINDRIRVVGLTATPFRLGHGYIHEESTLFNDMIEPVSISMLIDDGYLCSLSSKFTDHHLDTTGVKKRGGEFIEKQLQLAVNTDSNNAIAVKEILLHSVGRRSVLIFCSGIDHSEKISNLMNLNGVSCDTISSKTKKNDRDKIIENFKNYKTRAIASTNILSVGFDHDGVDMIVFLRPTMSPIVYIQQAGRGCRVNLESKKIYNDFVSLAKQ